MGEWEGVWTVRGWVCCELLPHLANGPEVVKHNPCIALGDDSPRGLESVDATQVLKQPDEGDLLDHLQRALAVLGSHVVGGGNMGRKVGSQPSDFSCKVTPSSSLPNPSLSHFLVKAEVAVPGVIAAWVCACEGCCCGVFAGGGMREVLL